MQLDEIVFRNSARLRIAPFALGVLVQRLAQKQRLAVGKAGNVARPDAFDREPVPRFDGDFERRAAKPVKQQAAERVEAGIARNAEAGQQLELALGLEISAPGTAVELIFELGQRVLVELRL